jgi:hypothetical protein
MRFQSSRIITGSEFRHSTKVFKNEAKYYYLHRDFFQRQIWLFRWLIA